MTAQTTAPAYIRHEKLVHLVIQRHFMWLIGSACGYEDMVQEGRMAIWLAEPEYTPAKGRETTYYARCVFNRLHHVYIWPLKSYKRRADQLAEPITKRVWGDEGNALTLMDTLAAPGADPADAATDRALAAAYMARIAGNSDWSEIIRMYYAEDKPMPEIARARGVSPQRVHAVVKRALAVMRA